MTLREYLNASGVRRGHAAIEIGIGRVQLWRLEAGLRLPSFPVARRIHEWSGGAVGFGDWPELIPEADAAAA